MIEIKKDLFDTIYDDGIEAICITTNGNYTVNGIACMGGGCARVCADRWPETAKRLGKMLKTFGTNVPFVIGAVDKDGNYLEPTREIIRDKTFKCLIFSFPTINNLGSYANMQLIKQSAAAMKDYADQFNLTGIAIGRPGAGIGGLNWADVKKEVENILDNRFVIVSFEHEE